MLKSDFEPFLGPMMEHLLQQANREIDYKIEDAPDDPGEAFEMGDNGRDAYVVKVPGKEHKQRISVNTQAL